MIRIIYRRSKCIGCGSCVEASFRRWRMSGKDGKANLIDARNKNGYHQVELNDDEKESAYKASAVCPEKIIVIQTIK